MKALQTHLLRSTTRGRNLTDLGGVRFEKQPHRLTISKERMVFGTRKQAKYISTSIVDLGRNVCTVVRPLALQHGSTFLAGPRV